MFVFICFFFFLRLSSTALAVSFNESCSAAGPRCYAHLAYAPSASTTIKSVASLFDLNPLQVIQANGFPLDADVDLPLNSQPPLKVPLFCDCISGSRTGNVSYTVLAGETLSGIAEQKFSGFVTYQEIASANAIADPDKIQADQKLVIPLPCACRGNAYGTSPATYMAYRVQSGDTLTSIGDAYGVNATTLSSVNNGSSLVASQVILVPLPACSADFEPGAMDEGLIVAQGSYILTAGACVQCACLRNSTVLSCERAPGAGPTCSTRCNQSLEIGNFTTRPVSSGCEVESCHYDGLFLNGIHARTQRNTTATGCTGVEPPPAFAYAPETAAGPEAAAGPGAGGDVAPPPTSGGDVPSPPGTPGGPPPSSSAPIIIPILTALASASLILSVL